MTAVLVSGCSGDNQSVEPVPDVIETVLQFYILTIDVTPNSGGIVLLTPAPNADGTYASRTLVKLTAVPASGYKFNSWSGDLTGNSNPVTIIMDKNKTITATFMKIINPVTPYS